MLKNNVVLFVLISLLLTGCQQSHQLQPNSLRTAITERIRTLDPGRADDTVSASIIGQIYETLLEYDVTSDKFDTLRPLLLKEMPTIEKNGSLFTLKLHDNINYYPDPCFAGAKRLVKAADVELAIKRLLDPAVQSSGFWTFSSRLIGDKTFVETLKSVPFTTWQERLKIYDANAIEGVQVVDDSTIKIEFNSPYNQFLYVLAMHFLAPIPREALVYYGEKFDSHPVGTGPFFIKNRRRNLSITLARNPHYWSTPAKLEEVNIQIVLESQPYWLKFMNNELDLIRIPKDNYDLAITADRKLTTELSERGIELKTASLPIIWYIGFNMADPVVGQDPLLRRAIAHAYDFNTRISLMTNNRAMRASTLLPPGIMGHNETSTSPIETDMTKARKLLSRSRYASLKNAPEIHFDLRGNSTTQRQWGEFFAKDMAQLGIKVKINLNSFVDYLEKEKSGRLQIFMGGWIADYPDPENFLQLLYGPNRPPGPNASQYNSSEFNQYFEKLLKTAGTSARLELIKKMVALVDQDLPWVPDFYSTRFVLTQPWLKNYQIHPFAYNSMKYLEIDSSLRQKTLASKN